MKHHDVSEVKVLERAHLDDGRLMAPLPDQESNQTDSRDDDEVGDKPGAEPIVFLSFSSTTWSAPTPKASTEMPI
jgi:hypothetical protein